MIKALCESFRFLLFGFAHGGHRRRVVLAGLDAMLQ
jgi:hypothetical protein